MRGDIVRFGSILFANPAVADGIEDLGPPQCFSDLLLSKVIGAVTLDEQLMKFFYLALHDVSAIHYRHEVFADLERDRIRQAIERFVAGMCTMHERLDRASRLWHRLQQQGWFVSAVEAFCDTVATLRDELAAARPSSRGLRDFAGYVAAYVASDLFRALDTETRRVQTELHKVRYTVHIEGLKIHVDRYEGESDHSRDIAAAFERFAAEAVRDYHVRMTESPNMNHVEEQILERVAKLFPEPFRQLDAFCTEYRDYLDTTISRFEHEVKFYVSYLAFVRRLTDEGLAFCYPTITDDPGAIGADSAFDAALAIKAAKGHDTVVRNDFHLSGAERIFVITGPNQGGKTTLARTIGQIAYLGTLGCPVPARRATLTLPDEIYTHFERQETLATLHGKLDDELLRIHEILSAATAASIVVMNESFSSTTVSDSVLIGAEVLDRIIGLGCVAVYVTFLDELANLDPVCVSMVGEVQRNDPTKRTFKFTRRRADGRAYAAALAEKYGLTRDAVVQRIQR
jgi:DNA mismatch repair protein MutS